MILLMILVDMSLDKVAFLRFNILIVEEVFFFSNLSKRKNFVSVTRFFIVIMLG